MAIRWSAEALRGICILPTAVADELHFASPPQLKVLLWLAVHEKEDVDVDACVSALRLPRETVEDALQYWVDRGIFSVDGMTPPPPAQTVPEEQPTAPAVTARPGAVKPQMKEVIARQKESAEFSALLEEVSARLGKPLSHGDMETLLYLYDTADIGSTVILMAVGYAVGRGKYSMRYIEKVLLSWQDSGITTIDAANEHLRVLEMTDLAADKVQKLLGRARELDARQRQMAYTWVYEWHFSDEMVALALAKAKEKGGAPVPYAHKILAGWFEEGITDAAALKKATAAATPAARRRGQTEETSLDVKGYETMLEDYVPTIPRKE